MLSTHLNEHRLRIIVLELEKYMKVLEFRNTQSDLVNLWPQSTTLLLTIAATTDVENKHSFTIESNACMHQLL
jgi:hypothetical protein